MDPLTEERFWDKAYGAISRTMGGRARRALIWSLRRILRSESYAEYDLWHRILPGCLSGAAGQSAIEIGSAPGDFLVRLSEVFGIVPYGVDYAEAGVALNRHTFAMHGLPPEQVFHGDFFSNEFQEMHRNRFNVVISRGFIEHFSDSKGVVDRHADLLAPGGLLIVSVPNLRGVNYALQSWCRPEVIPLHNLEIMDLEVFSALFDPAVFEVYFCGYQGMFDFGVINFGPGRLAQAMRLAGKGLQALLSPLLIAALRRRPFESWALSPQLLYIGRKLPVYKTAAAEGNTCASLE